MSPIQNGMEKEHLSRKARTESSFRWSPVLLSALVCPGLGQWVQRRRWLGVLQMLLAVGLVVGFLAVVFMDILALIPEYPPLDPVELITLSFEISATVTRENGTTYGLAILLFMAVYLYSVLDAFFYQRGTAPPAAPHPPAPREGDTG